MVRSAAAILLVLSGTTAAEPVGVSDRDFALDLYNGSVIGSVQMVGMGGTAISTAQGSSGTIDNPASAVVRRTTSHGQWDWDFHIDGLSSVAPSDFDNDGLGAKDGFASRVTSLGIALMIEGWGLAIVTTKEETDISGTTTDTLAASTVTTKVAIAHELLDRQWTAGAALTVGAFDVDRGRSALFSLTGGGLELGGIWRPSTLPFRAGATLTLPISGHDVTTEGCDPSNCEGYILPARVEAPWRIGLGFSWRRGPTLWNIQVPTNYRDERALTLAADLWLTSSVPRAFDLGWWGAQLLQPSGRHYSVSPHLGADWEVLPGRLRLLGGTYFEPARVADVHGRLHATAGLELALFQFHVSKWQFRPRFAATGDVARAYYNAGVSVGFWH